MSHRFHRAHLDLAVTNLRTRRVIAHATQGEWSHACDPSQPEVVGRVLAQESRPLPKGLVPFAVQLAEIESMLKNHRLADDQVFARSG